jgi:hypothetical protein
LKDLAPGPAFDETSAGLARDVGHPRQTLVINNGASDGPNKIAFGMLKPNYGFFDDLVEPETVPSWLAREDITYYAA